MFMDMVIVSDGQGNIVKMVSDELLTGKHLSDLIPEGDIATVLDAVARVACTQHSELFEYELDGKTFDIKIFPSESGVMVISIKEMTEMKKLSDSLRVANEKLQILSQITRHDILNYIMAADEYLHFIKEDTLDGTSLRYLKEVSKAISGIQEIVEFTRAYDDLGKDLSWVSLNDIILNLRGNIRYDCRDIEIYADTMISKVFYNLLDNSRRHGQAKSVCVTCEELSDGLIITWSDDGSGVPEIDKERIFQKGFGKNTGLGLFLCREILSINGISIKEVGKYSKGAKFEILVPKGQYRIKEGNF